VLVWYRARAKALASLLLVSLMTLGGASVARHHDDCHDTICVTSVVPHDPAAHSIGAAVTPDDHQLHCIVCHWIRGFKPALEYTRFLAPSVPDDVLVHVEFFSTPATFPAAQPPLRSPPISPATA
jgi:hypothetical protein